MQLVTPFVDVVVAPSWVNVGISLCFSFLVALECGVVWQQTKTFLRQHFWLRYFTLAAHRLQIIALRSWTVHSCGSVPDADEIYRFYRTMAGVELTGRIAEVGPGPGSSIGELLLRHGANHVDLVDSSHTGPESPNVTRYLVKADDFFRSHHDYDFILSTSLLEHVPDPARCLAAMATALAPAGMMIHRIDLRDHGMFSPPLHPLSFLRLPDWLYWPLAICGGVNRYLLRDYKLFLESSSLVYDIAVRHNVEIGSIRNCLAKRFREVSDEELSASVISLVAQKSPFSKSSSE